jgi:hypothetical protein
MMDFHEQILDALGHAQTGHLEEKFPGSPSLEPRVFLVQI